MTRLAAVAAIVVCAFVACAPAAEELTDAERIAIADTVLALSAQVKAAAESADVDATFRFYSSAPDASFALDGEVLTRDALVTMFSDIYAGIQGQEITLGDPTVSVLSADAILVVHAGRFVATENDGTTIESDLALTMLWVRRDGEWTLLHVHQSFPGQLGGS